jgi:O-antigen ligase
MQEITLNNSWNSKVWQRFDVVATFVAVLVVCQLAWQEDIGWIRAAAVALAVLIVGLMAWPYGILALLIGASAMPVFFVEVGGWNARPEHFAASFALVAVGIWLLAGKRPLKLNRLDYCILSFIAANFLSSAVGSSSPASTLKWALQNCLAVVFYFLIRVLIQDAKVLGRAFHIFLSVAVIESVYGIFCYLSHQLFDTSFGMSIGQYQDVAAPFGSMYEPNLFGAYTASAAVIFFSLYLFAGHRVRDLVCFLIAAIASFLSFSRANFVALLVVGAYLFWKSHRQTEGKPLRKLLTVGLIAALILAVFLSPLGQIVRDRFMNLFYEGLTEETTVTRAIVLQQALQEIPGHLLIGRGTASFNLTFDWATYMPAWAGEKTWIGNAPLRVLHDTGLLGLASIAAFFVIAWLKVRRAVKAPSHKNSLVVAMWAGLTIYAISYQSTDGTILAFTWVQLGLLASAATLLPTSSPVANHPGT